MKFIPQLFSGDMVQSIEAARKGVTRRVPTVLNSLVDGNRIGAKLWNQYRFDFSGAYVDKGPSIAGNPGPFLKGVYSPLDDAHHRIYPAMNPLFYEDEGGICLWVRESWRKSMVRHEGYVYRADMKEDVQKKYKWKPNFHMPKAAARIFLPLTAVSIERVQAITGDQAILEGIEPVNPVTSGYPVMYRNYLEKHWADNPLSPTQSFRSLWIKINGEKSWQENPFVYCIHFDIPDETTTWMLRTAFHGQDLVSKTIMK